MRPASPSTRRWVPGNYALFPGWPVIALLAGVLGIYLLLMFGGPFVVLLTAPLLAAPVAFIIWRRIYASLVLLVVLGAIHPFVMLLLFSMTQSSTIVKGAQLWKEVVVLVLLLRGVEWAFTKRFTPKVYFLDLLIGLFLVYAAMYVFMPSSLADSTMQSRIFGFRADTFFLFAYFVARAVPITVKQVRRLIIVYCVISLIISVIAGLQFLMPQASNEMLETLGFSKYLELQRGDETVSVAVRSSHFEGVAIPRASSLLLSDLALAFYSLTSVPVAAAVLVTVHTFRERLFANVFLLASLATTLFTVTRSAIVALGPMLTLALLRPRGIPVAFLIALQITAVLVPAMASLNITLDLLPTMFSPQEGSISAHSAAVTLSIETIQAEPLGRGLGTAGQSAQRLGVAEGITSESWYLHLGLEMGVVAAISWFAILLTFGILALIRYTQVRDPWLKALCLGMAGSTAGYGFVSATLQAWEGLTTSIIFWLLAGLVMRAQALEKEETDPDTARLLL